VIAAVPLERRIADLARTIRKPPPPAPMTAVELARRAGHDPDPWQRRVLDSGARQLLMNGARQSGKSTTAAVLGLHAALYAPGSLVLVLSPGERQSKLLFRKMLVTYRTLGHPVAAETENRLSLELANGSEIHALPGSEATVRGFSGVALLLIDEASRVDDALYMGVRPMLAVSGGRLVALSTPWGKRGWWYEAWEHGGPSWERYEVPAQMCPRIPAEFLEEERRSMPPLWFASEYECRFVDAVDQVFPTDVVAAAITPDVAPLFSQGGF